MAFFLIAYVVSFIAWVAGYLPIWGGWFIIGPILFPIVVVILIALVGAGTVGSFFGFASLMIWLEERQNKRGLEKLKNRVKNKW